MNIAKDFCDCVISWEVQENKRISAIVHCSHSQVKADKNTTAEVGRTLDDKSYDELEMDFAPVLLTPFLHPELTKATYCEMKIFVSPKLGVKLDKIIIVSTAKVTEFYDRNGEMLSLIKGDKAMSKQERQKNDNIEKLPNNGGKPQKASSRWFVNEYVPSQDTFEIMVRFCDLLVPNQLLIKYLGVKVIDHDWPVEVGSGLLVPGGGQSSGGGHIGSTGSICSNSVTLNCEKVMEAIQNVNNAVQILALEIGCVHRGSNPHLPTLSPLDTAALLKHRRPNSPMPPGTGSSSPNYWTGISARRSSDIVNLQMWLETRLTTLESTLLKGLEQLSNRISHLEIQPSPQNHHVDGTNQLGSTSSTDPNTDVNSNKSNEASVDERNSSCQKS